MWHLMDLSRFSLYNCVAPPLAQIIASRRLWHKFARALAQICAAFGTEPNRPLKKSRWLLTSRPAVNHQLATLHAIRASSDRVVQF